VEKAVNDPVHPGRAVYHPVKIIFLSVVQLVGIAFEQDFGEP